MKTEIGTMPNPVVIPKSAEQIEREHQGLCDLIRRDVRRIVSEELDKRGLVDHEANPVSTEEFIRRNPELHGLVRDAVGACLREIADKHKQRRKTLTDTDIHGIGLEMRRQLTARDMTTEVEGAILRQINHVANRLGEDIQAIRSELVAKRVDVIGDGRDGSVHGIESSGKERKSLADGLHPFVGVVDRRGRGEAFAGLREIGATHLITSLLCVACTILALKAFLEGGE